MRDRVEDARLEVLRALERGELDADACEIRPAAHGALEVITRSGRSYATDLVILGKQAQDVAEISARQGADVTLTSVFAIDKMQANPHEIEHALAEGIDIRDGWAPVEVVRGAGATLWGANAETPHLELSVAGQNLPQPRRVEIVLPLASPGGKPAAAIVLEIDPGEFIFPRIKEWPIPSATGESLLVRREREVACKAPD